MYYLRFGAHPQDNAKYGDIFIENIWYADFTVCLDTISQ